MVLYNFKAIRVVPDAKDFIDIVLSKTQRGTPTVVHNGWAITRIRQFYTRKVPPSPSPLLFRGPCKWFLHAYAWTPRASRRSSPFLVALSADASSADANASLHAARILRDVLR